jgi:stage V sporulation protein B
VADDKAQTAGRGVLYIAFAKFYFMFAGLIVQFRLPAVLSRVAWGGYSTVNSLISPVNNVLVTGTIQAVSRFSAQEPDKARHVQNAGMRMHLRFGLPLAIVYIASAPVVGWLELDRSLVAPLILGGMIVGGNAFYATFVGTANGLHQFHKQAGLDITFATVRTIGLIGMAMAGLGVIGVIGGWLAAIGVILVVAAAWVGMPKKIAKADRMPVGPMLKFFFGVAVYLALFNALMVFDTWLLKRLSTEYYAAHAADYTGALASVLPWASPTSGYHVDPSALANVQVGYYAAVQNLARLSYQAIIAATFVVFPLVSRSTFTDDRETTRRYIQVTLRYSLIFATAIGVVMAAKPTDMLGVVYAHDFAAAGGPALMILALGNVAFAVFAIAGTILNGAGLTRPAIITAAITLVLAASANYIAIPMAMQSGNYLEVAAAVTSAAMLLGALTTGFALYRALGAFVPVLSVVRVLLATAVAIVVGRALPLHGRLMSLVAAAIVALTFLVVLVVTRELGARDLDAIKAVRRKRAGQGDAR